MDLALKLATVLEYAVMGILFLLSIWSIAIMIDRKRALSGEGGKADFDEARRLIGARDAAGLKAWLSSQKGMHARALSAALSHADGDVGRIDRAVRSYLTEERLRMEKGLSVLATLGANAPFIGLFGTVLGIIRSFAALGESSGAASSVMSGISQALIATAAGLFVAIPAVIAFNIFSQKLRSLVSQCESLKDLFVANLAKGA